MTGFQSAQIYSEGGSGTQYYDSAVVWTSLSRTITNATVIRPLVNLSRTFPTAQTSQTGDEETETTYTAYGSDAFMIEQVTTEHPIVATGNNGEGGGTGDLEYHHLLKTGKVDFVRRDINATDYVISHYQYTGGQITKQIEDADTSSGVIGAPGGDFTTQSSVTTLKKETTTSYSKAGQKQLVTPPGGEDVSAVYRTRLLDGRLATLEYNDVGSGTYYGPAEYTVTNQAGQVEERALVGYSGNSTDAAALRAAHAQEGQSESQVAPARARADAAIAAIVGVPDGERTIANTLRTMDDVVARFFIETRMTTFMESVSPDEAELDLGSRASKETGEF